MEDAGDGSIVNIETIAQIRARREVNGWRKLGQEVIRRIEIYRTGQVSPVLLPDRIDCLFFGIQTFVFRRREA